MATGKPWKNEVGVLEMFLRFYDTNARGGSLRDCLFDVLTFYEDHALKSEEEREQNMLQASRTGDSGFRWGERVAADNELCEDRKIDFVLRSSVEDQGPVVKTEVLNPQDPGEMSSSRSQDEGYLGSSLSREWSAGKSQDAMATNGDDRNQSGDLAWRHDADQEILDANHELFEANRIQQELMQQKQQHLSLPCDILVDDRRERRQTVQAPTFQPPAYFPPSSVTYKSPTSDASFPQSSTAYVTDISLTTAQKKGRRVDCPLCHKTFSSQTVLRQHERVHTDERPYSCPLCSKSYKHKHRLKDHMLQHAGSKPYKCHICHKPFRRSDSLKTHLQVHANHRQRMRREVGTYTVPDSAFSQGTTPVVGPGPPTVLVMAQPAMEEPGGVQAGPRL